MRKRHGPAAGKGRCLATIYPSELFRPRQDLSDAQFIAAWNRGLEALGSLPGFNPASIFPDFGTISNPRYWGGRVSVEPGSGNPYIHAVAQTIEEALSLKPRPVDDAEMDGARAMRLYRELGKPVWYRTVDNQGPLNTAGLVLKQEELFMAMVEEPELVSQFVEGVTDFLIELWQWQRDQCGSRLCGSIWPYTFLPADLGMTLTEDLMPLLSAERYEEFGIPALQKINRATGGLLIHCCGVWGRHAPALAAAGIKLRAIEFHYPFTSIEELEPLAGETVFIPYIALDRQSRFKTIPEYWRWLMTNTPHRYWFGCWEAGEEYREVVEEVEKMT